MLRRTDAVGFFGIALIALGLLCFFAGPKYLGVLCDWLLGTFFLIVGCALAAAWPIVRLLSTADRKS